MESAPDLEIASLCDVLNPLERLVFLGRRGEEEEEEEEQEEEEEEKEKEEEEGRGL